MARQPKVTGATATAVHSYLHLVRQNGLHPYIKWPRAAVPKVSSWAVPDLCKAYDWPTGAPGGGVFAIIELGGGWTQADVTQFFPDAKLAPHITDVSVDGTTNSHCNPKNDADGEVALDIQVAGASYALAHRQSRKHTRLLVAGHHQSHCRRDRRWLRRMLHFLGC